MDSTRRSSDHRHISGESSSGQPRRSGHPTGYSSARSGGYSGSRSGGGSGQSRGSSSGGYSGGYRSRSPQRRQGGFSRPRHQGAYIDPRKFVNKVPTILESENFIPKHKFEDFGLMPELLKNLVNRKYTHPTPIQDAAITTVMKGDDVIGLANTGSGKTAAFALPMIHRMKNSDVRQVALIMAPTRELATQIDDEFKAFARGMQIHTALCVGGVSPYHQRMALHRNPQVVIGTPGRLKDFLNQGVLKLNATNILVLDEVDRMLDMGFIRDIRFIVDRLSPKRQTLCFSATITSEIKTLLSQMLVNPVTVSVKTSEGSNHIEQDIIPVEGKIEKLEYLKKMLKDPEFARVLVFGQTKFGVQHLAEDLTKAGIPSEAIHGNKSQSHRQRALNSFKAGHVRVLVATDVAARGIDIPNVSHVINFDQPNTYDDYIHRIGRTGRAGKRGKALTFVSPRGR